MTGLLQKATASLRDKLPFVLYSKPKELTIIGIFQNDNSLNLTQDFTEKGFAFVSFDRKKLVLIPKDKSEVFIENFEGFTSESNPDAISEINEKSKSDFENLVQKGIDAINSNALKKVVLSRKEQVYLKELNPIFLFEKLATHYPNAFCYCFFHPKVGLWLGATPEQLLKVAENKIRTVALAGTQVFKEDEITWEQKEKEEQQFVTDFIAENLKKYVSDLKISEPYTFKAGNIVHIKTDIVASINNKKDLQEILTALHPTPAVCGLPKDKAKEFIVENENYEREFYSGFLGELNFDFATNEENKSDLFVNLRCMKIEDKTANLYIGCGITKDSNPEKEFFETVNKSMTMKRILQ